jgi:hypothetical protein
MWQQAPVRRYAERQIKSITRAVTDRSTTRLIAVFTRWANIFSCPIWSRSDEVGPFMAPGKRNIRYGLWKEKNNRLPVKSSGLRL